MDKNTIRKKYLNIRNSLTETELTGKSRIIIESLKELNIYQEADVILTYIEYGSEVRTTELVNEVLTNNEKRIYCPKVIDDEIEFFEITSLDELVIGYKGIREPVIGNRLMDSNRIMDTDGKQAKVLIIIPGVVFDEKRNRLGYGKGFYDRFLTRYPSVIASHRRWVCGAKQSRPHLSIVALAYECQIASFVPNEAGDKKPDLIVTETRMISPIE